jgi:tRNA U38,U39,U40 pseudouridine synthase TruA
VPAAAVKRIVQVFDLVTRCKRPQRRLDRFLIKDRESIFGRLKKQSNLNIMDVKYTLYVEVKFAKI